MTCQMVVLTVPSSDKWTQRWICLHCISMLLTFLAIASGPPLEFFFVFLASQVGISSSKLASKFSSPKLFFYYYFFMYFGNLLSRNPSHTASRWNHEENQIFSTWRTQFIFFLFREIRYLKNMKFVNQCVH